ncbi:sugar ABC transporter ATP-binding protein [Treponema primitia]|uniref:sugar ABC transporter ATP-binding protein n=1 Tax=Treponema primitia TaxID=88058 RepID=UPI0002554F1F|nr:sugar ABC transporter ATP-binding protein [Treponema primitia]
MDMGVVLHVKNLSKSFPGVKALDNVSIDVNGGEILALLGENGAGKSTFIKIVSGAFYADSGDIYIENKKVDIRSPVDAVRNGINVVHQELNIVPWLDVTTNFMLGRERAKQFINIIDKEYSLKKTQESLDRLGFKIDITKKMQVLSFAEQQMVEVAKVISTNPKVIILDEPTASLAQKERENLYRVVESIKEQGVGIIYITHIFDEVFRLADRVTVLRDGKYIGTKDRAEIDEKSLIKMVVGREVHSIPRKSTTQNDIVLEVKNLNAKKVHNVSFNLKRGEILGIAGLAGAGRSEIVRALFGADKKDSGEILVEGKKVEINSPYDAYKSGIALVPEERKSEGLMMEMTMEYNNACASLGKTLNFLHMISYKKVKKMAHDAIKKFGINPPDTKRKAKLYSGGNQQKIVVSKCIEADPKILLIDEPTRGVDVGAKEEIHTILDKMVGEGKSIIIVSSELIEILKLSDRVLVIREGRIVSELNREEASQESIMQFAMGGNIHG